jgi:DNA-binding response OmpR family regulator
MSSRILYAEDEDHTRSLVADELRQAGYAVDTAADGEEAIRALGGASYDLVLLDIRMPGKSGIDVLQFLREQNLRPRVIMLTAVDDLSIAIRSVKLGANDYVTKPFRIEELLGAIERVLRR